VQVANHILEEDETLIDKPKRISRRMNWNNIWKAALRVANKGAVQAKRDEVARRHLPRASRDRALQHTIANAREWVDIELLLRTFKELKVNPLILSMPVDDIRLDLYGITPETRTAYLERLARLTRKYEFPLQDFHEYEKDPSFMLDFGDHLSASGWLYYNKAMDDFFHNAPARTP
jgi:D-alanine transfer protein